MTPARRPAIVATAMGDQNESTGVMLAGLGSKSNVPETDANAQRRRHSAADDNGEDRPRSEYSVDGKSSTANQPEVPFNNVDRGRSSSPTGMLNVRHEPRRHARGRDSATENGADGRRSEGRTDPVLACPTTSSARQSPIAPKASPERVDEISNRTSFNSSSSSSPFNKLTVDHRVLFLVLLFP